MDLKEIQNGEAMKNNEPIDVPMRGLEAWLPTKEETEHFYRCRCNEPDEPVCYWPYHRNLKG